MPMDISQVDHEMLVYFACQLEKEGQEIFNLYNRTRNLVDGLACNGWSGLGADRFFDEMYEVILPALGRLYEALNELVLVTRKVTVLFQHAEQEAADRFALAVSTNGQITIDQKEGSKIHK